MNDETARAFSAISALTPEQARDALVFLSGYTQAGFRAALECVAPSVLVDAAIEHDPDGVAAPIIAALDSESWTCTGCGASMIGRRPAGDRCRDCAGLLPHDMPSCGRCGAQDVPLDDVARLGEFVGQTCTEQQCHERARCAQRQHAAKAGAR